MFINRLIIVQAMPINKKTSSTWNKTFFYLRATLANKTIELQKNITQFYTTIYYVKIFHINKMRPYTCVNKILCCLINVEISIKQIFYLF